MSSQENIPQDYIGAMNIRRRRGEREVFMANSILAMRSGRIPETPSEISSIETFACDAASDLQLGRMSVQRFQLMKDSLIAEMKQVSKVERMAKYMLHPIRKLPAELLIQIFSRIAKHSLSIVYHEDAYQISTPIITVSQVCSSWRATAQCTPALWASMTITTEHEPTDPHTHIHNLISLHLSRSQGCFLSIVLVMTYISSYLHDIIRLLLAEAKRWQSVHLQIDDDWVTLANSYSPDPLQFPVLTKLFIRVNQFAHDTPLGIFCPCPDLVSFGGYINFPLVGHYTLSNVVTLHLCEVDGDDDLYDILQMTPSLRDCTIGHVTQRSISAPPKSILFSQLMTLDVSMFAIRPRTWQSIRLPNLSILTIRFKKQTEHSAFRVFDLDGFFASLSKSFPPLRELRLMEIWPEESFSTFLFLQNTITVLHLDLLQRVLVRDGYSELMHELKDTAVLPRLVRLTIEVTETDSVFRGDADAAFPGWAEDLCSLVVHRAKLPGFKFHLFPLDKHFRSTDAQIRARLAGLSVLE